MAADLKILERAARAQGFTVEHLGNDHLRWLAPDGRRIQSSATPSDVFAVKKILCDLKRIGFDPDWKQRKRATRRDVGRPRGVTIRTRLNGVGAASEGEEQSASAGEGEEAAEMDLGKALDCALAQGWQWRGARRERLYSPDGATQVFVPQAGRRTHNQTAVRNIIAELRRGGLVLPDRPAKADKAVREMREMREWHEEQERQERQERQAQQQRERREQGGEEATAMQIAATTGEWAIMQAGDASVAVQATQAGGADATPQETKVCTDCKREDEAACDPRMGRRPVGEGGDFFRDKHTSSGWSHYCKRHGMTRRNAARSAKRSPAAMTATTGNALPDEPRHGETVEPEEVSAPTPSPCETPPPPAVSEHPASPDMDALLAAVAGLERSLHEKLDGLTANLHQQVGALGAALHEAQQGREDGLAAQVGRLVTPLEGQGAALHALGKELTILSGQVDRAVEAMQRPVAQETERARLRWLAALPEDVLPRETLTDILLHCLTDGGDASSRAAV